MLISKKLLTSLEQTNNNSNTSIQKLSSLYSSSLCAGTFLLLEIQSGFKKQVQSWDPPAVAWVTLFFAIKEEKMYSCYQIVTLTYVRYIDDIFAIWLGTVIKYEEY